MRIRRTTRALSLYLLLATALVAPSAMASDLYAEFELGTLYGKGTPNGYFNTGAPFPDDQGIHLGSDSDSSPLYGLNFGLDVPLPEVLPWEMGFPGWRMRFETGLLFGLDFDFETMATIPADEAFFHSAESTVTWLTNVWLDMPVYRPIARLFAPVPLLKPISFYMGGGVGMAVMKVSTQAPATASGSASTLNLAYQAGAGFSYALTHRVSLSLGYRYLNLGETEVVIKHPGLPDSPFGLDLDSHGFDAGLRVKYYSVDFPASLWGAILR